jgi:hypothetical protein
MGTAHVENRRLFAVAAGRLKLEEWEQLHLHVCEVCQSVLYVFMNQPSTTLPQNSPKNEDAA